VGLSEREAYLAFNLTDRIGSVTVEGLVREFGSVSFAWESYPEEKKISRTGGEVDWRGEFAKAEALGVTVLTPADAGYPPRLLETPGHPLALYVKGDVTALSRPSLAIVGTRRATAYGLDRAFAFARDLAESGWSVVSGLALGIDAEAHRGALSAKGTTVGVLGSGLDEFYPEENRELAREIVKSGGAVVSEFPFGRVPDTQTFPQRNHVVAALVQGVIAIEAPLKSGTLLTTGFAAELGRTVMAVPGRVDSKMSQGCLKLIRDGARMVRNATDVEEEFSDFFGRLTVGTSAPSSVTSPVMRPSSVSLEESLILKHLDNEGLTIDRLVSLTGLPVEKVTATCMKLRLRDKVRYFPGNRVALPREA
jgi:DNA processing protein